MVTPPGHDRVVESVAYCLQSKHRTTRIISATHVKNPDIILIGSGIMASNLGAMLKRLDPRLSIQLYEATDGLAQESSDGWNNALTRRHL
jgi:hypothetical protein